MELRTTGTSKIIKHSGGFTLIELLIVVIIIAVAGALAFPSIKNSMNTMEYQKQKQELALFFKRTLIKTRFDGKARQIVYNREDNTLVCDNQVIHPFDGDPEMTELLKNGKTVDSLMILPFEVLTAGVKTNTLTLFINLYDGTVTEDFNE